jgi:hypothetical protein
MGLDELYLIARAFVPHAAFPEIRPPASDTCSYVVKNAVAVAVADFPVSKLQETGVWSRIEAGDARARTRAAVALDP